MTTIDGGGESWERPTAEHLRAMLQQSQGSRTETPQWLSLSAWTRGLEDAFLPMDCEIRDTDRFGGYIRSHSLVDIFASEVRSDPHLVRRSESHIARRMDPTCYLNLQLSGCTTVRQDGHEIVSRPGDMVMIDTLIPFEIESDAAIGLVCFSMPTALLRGQLSRSVAGFPLHLDGCAGLSAVLGSFALALFNDIPGAGDPRLRGALLRTLALAVDGGHRENAPLRSQAQEDLLCGILSYMDANLRSPNISVATVAARFRISERYLHKLFETSGDSFHRTLLRRRAGRCHDDIAAAAGRGTVNISAIAYHWGFNDLSTFYRSFRRIYGYAPGDLADQHRCSATRDRTHHLPMNA